MYSLMKQYTIHSQTLEHNLIMTAIRMSNDINGNPRHKVQVWSLSNNTIWTPKVNGYRRFKDDSYVLKCSHNLEESMNHFMSVFEVSINE